MQIETLRDLLKEQVKDLYSGERQIIDTLPDVIRNAQNPQLREALEKHLEETREQKTRLEEVAEHLSMTLGDHDCKGIRGILEEGDELIEEHATNPDARDAAIITAAQKVEHYEIAGYGSAVTFAKELDEDDVASLLDESLSEEKSADKKLTKIAKKQVNLQAMPAD